MTKKVFISYSHKDEAFKDSLIEHLSSLKRRGVIESWNDREIKAGDEWSDEINAHLNDADIVLLLISSSFNASEYCTSTELKGALEKHENSEALVIPIILRACDWQDLPYSKLQGLPKDGRPIQSWVDKDEAWLDVIDGIKKSIENFKKKDNAKQVSVVDSSAEDNPKPVLSLEMQNWLDDTEIKLNHRVVDTVKLDSIYVVPDLEDKQNVGSNLMNMVRANDLLIESNNIIIFGEDQMGKTSLLKYFYRNFAKNGQYVLYLDVGNAKFGKDIKNTLINEINNQYRHLSIDDFFDSDSIVLLDNFHQNIINKSFKIKLLNDLIALHFKIIITCDFEYNYVVNEFEAFDDFYNYKLLGLGNKRREELIKKWVELGRADSISEKDLYTEVDLLKGNIDRILYKNIVPARPFYILVFLQMFEAHKKLNIELTSFGHCYQELIYKTFENIKINSKDYSKYINILTELAWFIFSLKKNKLNQHEIDCFFNKYDEEFLSISNERDVILDNLIKSHILVDSDMDIYFKYPYIYYFFVAKKIAENCNNSELFQIVLDELIDKLHMEESANILIFVTHHTKNKLVLEKIQNCLCLQFSQAKEATLNKNELDFITDFLNEIPNIVLEQREIQKERDYNNENLDYIENSELSLDESNDDANSFVADINRLFKSTEIAGQIVKNRHYDLTRDEMSGLSVSSIDASLRFLSYFLEISESSKDNIVRLIHDNMSKNPDMSSQAIKEFAEKAYLYLTYNILSATIQKISNSIGTKEADEIYEKIVIDKDTPAYLLVRLSIELQFKKNINMPLIKDMNKRFKDNVVCSRLMREFIVHHLYMFPVEYNMKQKIADILDIKMDKQRILENSSRGGQLLDFNQFKA
ncbi:Uncharacterised protein [Moraxella lacunata]|uniref:TIR domain-containing protein n=1 Tax=Moraxella lacunata TaxID=477 RepID=A0A378QGT1_MORLA|nr:toll/interleukin-1 receptor domain-containing protein [Moraxella lacunata]STZ00117.1 Uncharacterised protein [Moraxella lacunata]